MGEEESCDDGTPFQVLKAKSDLDYLCHEGCITKQFTYNSQSILPLEREITSNSERNRMPQADTISILCVDDEPLFLDAFSQKLGQEDGFSIVSVSNAAEALRSIESSHFDAI
ncbi:MAG: response regulator, partial [Methanoregula sp.]